MPKAKRTAKHDIVAADLRNLREQLEHDLLGLELPTRLRQVENWELTKINVRRFMSALSHAWVIADAAVRQAQSELEQQQWAWYRSKLAALSEIAPFISSQEHERLRKVTGQK